MFINLGIGFSSSYVSKVLSVRKRTNIRDSHLVENELISPKKKEKKTNIINCAENQKIGDNETGIRKIYPSKCCMKKTVKVFCDQETDGRCPNFYKVMVGAEIIPVLIRIN
ncbi:hypothetical protein Anas_04075 [Armadillidium nasatum]|uniref:Uncharacterized protein n=1 Tax=Armadillidium nasatum TaxID=96803 RepID=A0A5N5TJM2_9CRUS|nr:hypothetical protein Anas_04075 [Armadillidium nasatum]